MNTAVEYSDLQINDLWERGKVWEIFGFSDDSFSTFALASQYSYFTLSSLSPETQKLITSAFSLLNAPLTRKFYLGSRMMMDNLRKDLGNDTYSDFESQIWTDLWGWVFNQWKPFPDELYRALIQKYKGRLAAPTFIEPVTSAEKTCYSSFSKPDRSSNSDLMSKCLKFLRAKRSK